MKKTKASLKESTAPSPISAKAESAPDLSNRAAIRPEEFCALFGFSKNKFYMEVRAGRIKTMKAGKMTLLDAAEPQAYLNRLREAAAA